MDMYYYTDMTYDENEKLGNILSIQVVELEL